MLVKLSEELFSNLSEENYYKLIQCFDTLVEFLQGPCIENQRYLSESKFLVNAQNILESYYQVEEYYLFMKIQEQNKHKYTLSAFNMREMMRKDKKTLRFAAKDMIHTQKGKMESMNPIEQRISSLMNRNAS